MCGPPNGRIYHAEMQHANGMLEKGHTHAYTCIHTHIIIYMFIHAYTHIHMHTHMHISIHACTCMHITTHIHIHTCAYTCIHVSTQHGRRLETE